MFLDIPFNEIRDGSYVLRYVPGKKKTFFKYVHFNKYIVFLTF